MDPAFTRSHSLTTLVLSINLVKMTSGQRRKALCCRPGGRFYKRVTSRENYK